MLVVRDCCKFPNILVCLSLRFSYRFYSPYVFQLVMVDWSGSLASLTDNSDGKNALDGGPRRDQDIAIIPRRARDETMLTLIEYY